MKPIVLIILDGFGHPKKNLKSPWQSARHPNFSEIERNFPFTLIQASGLAVGLPWGEPGNSEVGHLTIGSGKIIYSHLPRVISAIQDKTFFQNEAFVAASEQAKKNKSNLHIMGLFSSGSVHAYAEHLYALLDFCKEEKVEKVCLHLFTDGRDAYSREGGGFFIKLEESLEKNYPNAKVASVIGRHYAMDREKNWDRIEKTYKLLTEGADEKFEIASRYIAEKYKGGITDEFMPAAEALNSERIKNGDAVIFFNYREDSSRELASAFVQEDFNEFNRRKLNDLLFVTMTQYGPELKTLVAFPPLSIQNPLAKIISDAGLKQLHVGESEKYAHITYFINGGREEPFKNEERILVSSPKAVSYDEVPEMSAYQITDKLLENLDKGYDFILANFANADMVGHTGNFDACARAIEVLDECVGKILKKILEIGGTAIITSDHGNIEEKIYAFTGEKRTNHTINPVPFFLISNDYKRKNPLRDMDVDILYRQVNGTIADVAPTVLKLLGLEPSVEMIGQSLIPRLK